MIVLDANILIRAVLGRRVRELLERYAGSGIRFLAPDAAFADAEKYLPLLLEKRGMPSGGVSESLKYLQLLIEPVELETYSGFEAEARERLHGRDEEDWPVLATAWRWRQRFGPKTQTSLEPGSLFGPAIASRSS